MALLPVEEALARILDGVKPGKPELTKLDDCLGRVLAAPVKALRDQPPFPASAMDGYAIIADDPSPRKIVGTSQAGKRFASTLKKGQAVRIFTGAPVPKGADTILIQENAKRENALLYALTKVNQNQNIRAQGLDFKKGSSLLDKGIKLTARDLLLAASANAAELKLYPRPRIAILSTGDELVAPGEKPGPDQIVSSNATALAGFIRHYGAEPINLGIVPDKLSLIRRAIRKAAKADVLVTTGGASVGDHDLVQDALKAEGIKLDFWKIAMRPGKPLMFAKHGKQRILGLPGNPVSALVCARVFLKPLIDAMLGLPTTQELRKARLTVPLKANGERQDYIRAKLSPAQDGTFRVEPFTTQDSSMQRLLAEANALIIRRPHALEARSGELVDVLEIDF